MFKIIIGVVFTIAIVVGACILCVKQEKKMSEEAAQKKQIVERERAERAKRIENNPAFQRMMDRCVGLFLEDLLLCERNRDSLFVYIYVHGGMIDVHHTYKKHEITYRRYDMEDIKNLETLLAFMEASKIYLPKKIYSELANRGIDNCVCSVTCKRETREWDDGTVYKSNLIKVECEFKHTLNKW